MRASLECSTVGTHESSRKDQVWQLNFHVVNVVWTQLQPSEMFFELHESFDPRLAIFLAGCVTHQHLDLKDSMIWQLQHFAIALVYSNYRNLGITASIV